MDIQPAIDFVYTWVDGGDADYLDVVREYARETTDTNPERYRDAYDLLKYSLRSLQRFCPWYRNIYIVTCRPQVPEWLNTDHPAVRIVHHDEMFDNAEYLPTFNSNVIESYLHRIPGLSDRFVYLNDDHLFGRDTTVHDFIDGEGRIRVMGTLLGERLKFRVYQDRHEIVSLGFVEHTPLMVEKAAWAAMLDERPARTRATRLHRFRTGDDLQPDKLYRVHMLSKCRDRSRAVPFFQLVKFHRFHKITNDLKRQRKGIARIRCMRPKFYCLNDDQRRHPNPEVVELVKRFLDTYYPEPSEFEKGQRLVKSEPSVSDSLSAKRSSTVY